MIRIVPCCQEQVEQKQVLQVVIPVNDNTDPDKPGGSHWSILCYVQLPAGVQFGHGVMLPTHTMDGQSCPRS